MIDIKYADIVGTKVLEDGDKIAVQVTENACPESSIKIGLRLGPGITWWKGIQLDEIVVVQCQDTQNESVSAVGYSEFKHRNLNFWKAKTFGAHTPMYTVVDAKDNMEAGNQYLFEWLKD